MHKEKRSQRINKVWKQNKETSWQKEIRNFTFCASFYGRLLGLWSRKLRKKKQKQERRKTQEFFWGGSISLEMKTGPVDHCDGDVRKKFCKPREWEVHIDTEGYRRVTMSLRKKWDTKNASQFCEPGSDYHSWQRRNWTHERSMKSETWTDTETQLLIAEKNQNAYHKGNTVIVLHVS